MLIPSNIKTILIAPLDWGLGHASRCIPLIKRFVSEGKEVLLAADGDAYTFLSKELPEIKIIRFKGYRITYSAIIPLWFKLFLQIPKIITRTVFEHHELKKIISQHQIDMVVSDNRYGLWNKNIHSVLITHQLNIRASFLSPLVNFINRWFINQYSECWVPDHKGEENLSGELSHGTNISANVKYINPLSRFQKQVVVNEDIDLLCIISGPEPQRSVLEYSVREAVADTQLKNSVVVGGTFSEQQIIPISNIKYIPFAGTAELQDLISRSKIVLARAGYSTIMDLHAMNKKMILVPTPGQTEQEYLAAYLSKRSDVCIINQHELSGQDAFYSKINELFKQETVKTLVE